MITARKRCLRSHTNTYKWSCKVLRSLTLDIGHATSQTTGTQRTHTSLLCGSAISTAIAAICRRSQAVTADVVAVASGRAWKPLSRPAAAATGSILQQLAEKPAAEPGYRLRWPVCDDAPAMRRSCAATEAAPAPLRHAAAIEWQREPSTQQTLSRQSALGFPHGARVRFRLRTCSA